MKSRPTQFGVRENTASSRPHAPCLAVDTGLTVIRIEKDNPEIPQPSTLHDHPVKGFESALHTASQNAPTGEERKDGSHLLTVREVAELLQVPVSWVYGRMRKRSSERLPGYRLGKYWRF